MYILTDLRSYGSSLGYIKTNAVGLNIKNLIRSPKHRKRSVTQVFVDLEYYVRI